MRPAVAFVWHGQEETLHMNKISSSHPPPPAVDEDGPEELYARCRTVLRPALAGRLGSMTDAEDVLHEAFVRFLKSYAGRTVINPLALLGRIAMNIIRDGARSESFRRQSLGAEAEPVCAISPPPDPEASLSSRQEVRLLQEAIDRLPARCREVFLLHRVEGLPQAEVARILGISVSAVEKNLTRANGHLRSALDGWAVDRRCNAEA
jgi:RNA polymerase sigma factor (sigma-70 family)